MSKVDNRILVIDDDPGIRDSFKAILTLPDRGEILSIGDSLFPEEKQTDPFPRKHYDLTTVSRGEEGIKAAKDALEQEKPFDVAFIDMKMPGMDGAETAKHIWKIDPDIKIIIVTAFSEYAPEDIIRVAGRDDVFYLRKPFNPEEIRQFARSLVHQRALERERDRLHETLEAANVRLEAMVADRTHELQTANRRLEELNQDKMTFLRFLSHEMNTPLNWIGAVGIIEQAALSESDRQMLSCVEEGFNRINGLLRAVLAYFEMAGQELELRRKSILIYPWVSDIFEARSQEIQDAGIRVNIRIEPYEIVEADPVYFRELLETVLGNALDYSNPGGTVTVTIKQNGDTFRLEIEDQGKGIPEENLDKIFQAFATESFHRREAGYGLSLPRARLIAEAHGWRIWIESEGVGKGTRLVVST